MSDQAYRCPRCSGSGEVESSDSTDDVLYRCSRCVGTGKCSDRRRGGERRTSAPSAHEERLREALRRIHDRAAIQKEWGWAREIMAMSREALTDE